MQMFFASAWGLLQCFFKIAGFFRDQSRHSISQRKRHAPNSKIIENKGRMKTPRERTEGVPDVRALSD
jgi:hypothetical protein